MSLNISESNEEDTVNSAMEFYKVLIVAKNSSFKNKADKLSEVFNLHHCWEILKYCKKFQDLDGEKTEKTSSTSGQESEAQVSKS